MLYFSEQLIQASVIGSIFSFIAVFCHVEFVGLLIRFKITYVTWDIAIL